MCEPMKYDDLDYTPAYGVIDVRGENGEWGVPVSVRQGRAMERNGFSIKWVYATVPAWIERIGLSGPYVVAYRLLTWPQRRW